MVIPYVLVSMVFLSSVQTATDQKGCLMDSYGHHRGSKGTQE